MIRTEQYALQILLLLGKTATPRTDIEAMRFGAERILGLCSILAFWTKRIALPPSFPRLYLLTPFKQVMISKRNGTIAWRLLSRVRFKRLWLLSFIFLGTRLPWRELLRIALIWASVSYYWSAWIHGPSPFDDREIEFHLTFHFIPQILSAKGEGPNFTGLEFSG